MFACCNIGGFYIEDDGTINFELYLSSVRSALEYRLSEIEKRGKLSKKMGISEITFHPNKICKCPCHSIANGNNIMH